MNHTDLAMMAARVCLVLMFPFSAIDKIVHWDDALAQANSSFLPGGPLLLIGAMAIEFITPILIGVEWHARPAAAVLATFCVVTAVLYHPFWRHGDFWAKGASVDRDHFWDFTKNFGLAGGLSLVALGGGLS